MIPLTSRWSNRLPDRAFLLVPPAFGLLSVLLGQDANWDLQNYHLYNPWAFLTGRIGHDLAPAGLQSYFNPLIDLPYHWMTGHLPPRAVAFLLGAFQGLNFLLLRGIARRTLPAATPGRVPAMLALAGCLGAAFLSELGNTMGDNATALCVLGAAAWLLRAWPALEAGGWRGAAAGLAGGLLVGTGVGLKLTNAPYAVGLAAALFWALRGWTRPGWRPAAVAAAALGLGVALGIAATAGYWFARMWQEFGNPLFPQFNALFRAELAVEGMVADTRWRPRGLAEWLLFPVVFTLRPERFGEVPILQLLWPVAYGLFGAWALEAAWRLGRASRRARPRSGAALRAPGPGSGGAVPAPARFVLAFLAVSYLAWMVVFSIGRYAVAMELLLPLATWIAWHRLAAPRRARRWAAACIAAAVAVSVARFETWGHAGWAERHYAVEVPSIPEPQRSTLLVLASPAAWLLPHFPPALVHVSLNSPTLPESAGYRRRADGIVASRPGPVYALVAGAQDARQESLARLNRWTAARGLQAGGRGCRAVAWGLRRLSKYRRAEPTAGAAPGACAFALPADQRKDLAAEDRVLARTAAAGIAARGLDFGPADCAPLRAWLGAKPFAFQFCTVRRSGPPVPG